MDMMFTLRMVSLQVISTKTLSFEEVILNFLFIYIFSYG